MVEEQRQFLVSTMTLDEGLQLVAGLDERLVEELLTGPVLLEAGLLAGMDCGLCDCSSKEVKLVKTVGKSCYHSA